MVKKKPRILILALIIISVFTILFTNLLSSKKSSIQSNGTTREYLVHVPRAYDHEAKLPLIIALHGYTDNPRLMEFYSGLSRKAEKEKFIVVYPYGTKSKADKNLSWNGGSCCGTGAINGVKDVEFINSLTEELVNKYKINQEKVYLIGFSNGGLLAYRIASETPEKYKAVAVISGSIGGKVYKQLPDYNIPTPRKPISILLMHGLKDERIPYDGGENADKDGVFRSFKQSSDFWIKNNKCERNAKTENGKFIHEVYENCELGTKVETYSVKQSGHMWFGGLMEINKILRKKTVPATDILWSFFEKSQ